MGKHYEISGNELKILSKYLQNYADAPFKSSERNSIVNQATKELIDAGYDRWCHKNVMIYFNNNKKNAEKQSNPQITPNQIMYINKPVNSQKQQGSQFETIKMQENPINGNSQQPISQSIPNFGQPKLTPQAQINQSQLPKAFSSPPNSFLNSLHSPITAPKEQELATPKIDDLKLSTLPSQKVDKEVENKNQPKISPINSDGNDDIICPQYEIFNEDQSQNFDVDSESSLKFDDENQFKIIQPASNSNDIHIPQPTHISSSSEKLIKDDNGINNDNNDSKSCFRTQNSQCEFSDSIGFKSVSFDTQEDQYSEASESCSQSEVFSNPLNLEELANQLPEDRAILPEELIDLRKYDMLKYELNQTNQRIIEINHKSALCDSKVSERLQFQKKIEKKFVFTLNELERLLKTKNIYSHDSKIQTVNAPNIYRCVSSTTRQYNNEAISPVHSRPNSQILNYESDDSYSAIDKSDQDFIKEKYLNDLTVRPHKPSHLQNQKLENLCNGKFDSSKTKFDKFENPEVSVIVSYHINKSSTTEVDDDLCVCEIAYINNYLKKKSFILHFNSKSFVINSLEKVFAMSFHRHENVNKIFVCGQKLVKELTIIGFDEFIQNENEDFEIVETNSFSFDNNNNNNSSPKAAVITVWDDELVLGFGTSLYFWEIEKVKPIQSKYSFKANAKKLISITSLCVIEDSTKSQSLLAVASFQYPVIYIYNKNHENVSRLVSHTMGISSLKSLGSSLFSGSLDMNVRIWNVEKGVPEISFNSQCERIKTFEIGFFLDDCFLFLADENVIQCFNISKKKFLFAMPLIGYVMPKQMVFLTGKNTDSTDYARLVVLMEFYKEAYVPSSKTSDVMLTIEFI